MKHTGLTDNGQAVSELRLLVR